MQSIFMKCLLRKVISSWRFPFLCCPPFGMRRSLSLAVLAIHLVPALAGSKTEAAESQISVLYAGSLGNLMETDVGPSFNRATGCKYLGEAKGSVLSANLIKEKLRTPDVFISADPKVNQRLMGSENGNLVRWYATIFGNEMVLGYNPNSRFAAKLKQVGTNDLKQSRTPDTDLSGRATCRPPRGGAAGCRRLLPQRGRRA